MRSFLTALLLVAVLVHSALAQSSVTATSTTAAIATTPIQTTAPAQTTTAVATLATQTTAVAIPTTAPIQTTAASTTPTPTSVPTTPTPTPAPTTPTATPTPTSPYVPPFTLPSYSAWQWLQANAASTAYYQTILNAPAPVSAPLIALLNGTAGPTYPYYVTVFLPESATTLTVAQIQLSIVIAYNGQSIPAYYNVSTTNDGAILTTLYVEPLLGLTPSGIPNVPLGTPGQQAIKLGKSGSTYTVLASPNVAPVTISTHDVLVRNGAIQIYTTGSVLTPAGNAETVLSNLQSPTSGFFSIFIGKITPGAWALLNNLTSPLVTGSIGYTLLLPTNVGLAALEGSTGPGLAAYLTTAAGGAQGAADLSSIFSYHIIPSPGFSVGYSYALKYALTLAGGAKNFTTGFAAQQLQLSLTSTGLFATSFAALTGPTQIGGQDTNQATVPLDLIIGNGVVHGLQGILLPTAVQLLIPKVILGGGFSQLTYYLGLTGLNATLNNPTTSYTVLAPTDAAFAAFLVKYPNPSIATLTEVLTLHVISGVHATNPGKVGTLPAATYPTALSGSSVVVGGANSAGAQTVNVLNGGSTATLDSTATSIGQNGYVYSINAVLLPASLDPPTAAPTVTATPTGNASPVSMSVVGVIAAVVVALAFRA